MNNGKGKQDSNGTLVVCRGEDKWGHGEGVSTHTCYGRDTKEAAVKFNY